MPAVIRDYQDQGSLRIPDPLAGGQWAAEYALRQQAQQDAARARDTGLMAQMTQASDASQLNRQKFDFEKDFRNRELAQRGDIGQGKIDAGLVAAALRGEQAAQKELTSQLKATNQAGHWQAQDITSAQKAANAFQLGKDRNQISQQNADTRLMGVQNTADHRDATERQNQQRIDFMIQKNGQKMDQESQSKAAAFNTVKSLYGDIFDDDTLMQMQELPSSKILSAAQSYANYKRGLANDEALAGQRANRGKDSNQQWLFRQLMSSDADAQANAARSLGYQIEPAKTVAMPNGDIKYVPEDYARFKKDIGLILDDIQSGSQKAQPQAAPQAQPQAQPGNDFESYWRSLPPGTPYTDPKGIPRIKQ